MHKLENHSFFKTVIFEDSKFLIDKGNGKLSDIIWEDVVLNEYEFYIQKNSFYLVHFTQLCDQLVYGVELISNFNYNSKKMLPE